MNRFLKTSLAVSVISVCSLAWGQGGHAGNFGYGGMQGGSGGNSMQDYNQLAQIIDQKIANYLTRQEIKSILTPGEYCEWILDMKAGQVVIADANSEAFDPAIEIIDSKLKIVGSNDDRYPGDQRPLLLWRCPQDGKYNLHVRCFRNKSGGRVNLRYQIFDTIDFDSDKAVEKKFEHPDKVLIRIPMKRGQVKQLFFERAHDTNKTNYYAFPQVNMVISPSGLPDINLAQKFGDVLDNSIIAPVDGDYYYLVGLSGGGLAIRGYAKEIVPISLDSQAKDSSSAPKTNERAIWKVKMKAGEVLEFSTPNLYPSSQLTISEEPPFATYDVNDPEKNPFYPSVKEQASAKFTILPGRARDSRVIVCSAQRDLNLWIASRGYGPVKQDYRLVAKNALKELEPGKMHANNLTIGKTDYWIFEAKPGDVMSFKVHAKDFASRIVIRDPDLSSMSEIEAQPDQEAVDWSTVINQEGRYIISVATIGDGGGGEYSIQRKVFPAKEFSKGNPAKGTIKPGDIHVWSFTTTPDEPVLIHMNAAFTWIRTTFQNNAGAPFQLPWTTMGKNGAYALFNPAEKSSYLLVITGIGEKSDYMIELLDVPGIKKSK